MALSSNSGEEIRSKLRRSLEELHSELEFQYREVRRDDERTNPQYPRVPELGTLANFNNLLIIPEAKVNQSWWNFCQRAWNCNVQYKDGCGKQLTLLTVDGELKYSKLRKLVVEEKNSGRHILKITKIKTNWLKCKISRLFRYFSRRFRPQLVKVASPNGQLIGFVRQNSPDSFAVYHDLNVVVFDVSRTNSIYQIKYALNTHITVGYINSNQSETNIIFTRDLNQNRKALLLTVALWIQLNQSS